jgi:hypothetical protein
MECREIGWENVYQIDVAQDRDQGQTLVNMMINV